MIHIPEPTTISTIPLGASNCSLMTYPFPTMTINKSLSTVEDIEALQLDDFKFEGYQCHPAIKAEMAV